MRPLPSKEIHGNLIHLSFNMWCDRVSPEWVRQEAARTGRHLIHQPSLRLNSQLWREITQKMAASGFNLALLDIGDAVRYESHPEIAVRHAWPPGRLKEELTRLRAMGLEPIPKLNFSAAHDVWLGPYARCISTDTYYAVCRDLIAEVIEIFDRPRFFHIGMDEETAWHQRRLSYVVIRQHELWWHDLRFFVNEIERHNVRAWIWSDFIWEHRDVFLRKMPKSVVQSNWYYGIKFSKRIRAVEAFQDLEAHGYDQVPTGSDYYIHDSIAGLTRYCRRHIAPERLLGFLQTVWKPTLSKFRRDHLAAIETMARTFS